MYNRKLGRSGIEVSAMGLGCWAIGGPYTAGGKHVGWGDIDDEESIRSIHRGMELGVTFFDTAACYGCGHSERVLGRAIEGRRDDVVIATKFGHLFDEDKREATGDDPSPKNLRRSCEASLKRLSTDCIDLLQFHMGGYDPALTDDLLETLSELVATGMIRAFGWSTDKPESITRFAGARHCAAVQQHLNVLEGNLETLHVAEREGLASINRGPLAKGVLTGKFDHDSRLPANDVRHHWDASAGALSTAIDVVGALRDVLTSDGRSLAQGSIAWLWKLSEVTVPIPGFKTVKQVEDNAGALRKGPLNDEQMRQIDSILEEAGWTRQRFA